MGLKVALSALLLVACAFPAQGAIRINILSTKKTDISTSINGGCPASQCGARSQLYHAIIEASAYLDPPPAPKTTTKPPSRTTTSSSRVVQSGGEEIVEEIGGEIPIPKPGKKKNGKKKNGLGNSGLGGEERTDQAVGFHPELCKKHVSYIRWVRINYHGRIIWMYLLDYILQIRCDWTHKCQNCNYIQLQGWTYRCKELYVWRRVRVLVYNFWQRPYRCFRRWCMVTVWFLYSSCCECNTHRRIPHYPF